MRLILAVLALCASANAQVLRQNGVPATNAAAQTFTSTVTVTGSGSTCFSVDNPTLVVDCGNNRVGIGTASPSTALDVSGTATASAVETSSITVNVSTLKTVDNKVGIGTSSPGSALHVVGSLTEDGASTFLGTTTFKGSGATVEFSSAPVRFTGNDGPVRIVKSLALTGSLSVGSANNQASVIILEDNTGGSTDRRWGITNNYLKAGALTFGASTALGATDAIDNTKLAITNAGHLESSGTITSATCNAGTIVMSAGSNDMSGEFVAGAASANCTITFGTAFTRKPRCWCNDESQILVVRAVPTTTTLKCDVAIGFGGDTIQYGCQAAP